VSSRVRLEVVIAVVEKGKKIIAGVEGGGLYASEIKMLRRIRGGYWRKRYMIEQVFGSIKEDLARKADIAYAILWNFYVLVTSFLISLSFVKIKLSF